MRCIITVFAILFGVEMSLAQKIINHEIPVEGQVELAAGIKIPKANEGYTLWLPEKSVPKGLVVFTHPRRDTLQSEEIIDYALEKQLAVLYATTDNRLEFFFDAAKMQEVENYIYEVVVTHGIPPENLLYCGMSLEGTRAVKLAIFGQSDISQHHLKPRAIAICDAPLDMVRFHKEMVKAKELAFMPATANEGNWVSAYLEKNLGGTPKDSLNAYVSYSPYCYRADGGENIRFLKDIAIRAYTEPDVHWWMETRRKDFYAMNAIDLAAFVNLLNIMGNEEAALITTVDKGYHPDGKRHPHSWNIVDEKELIDWFLTLIP